MVALGCDRAGEIYKMRTLGAVVLGLALGGCAIQRAEIAQDARVQMVGMSKEQVLACMGAPATKAAEGKTEVWGFNSGNGMTVVDASYGRYGSSAVASSRFCNINIVFASGQVATVNYAGPTGGLLTAGEQCAYAVNACVKRQ
jgi:outer membrane protein assembly factor BamE (lipoprotein component of BamABCDE complex)